MFWPVKSWMHNLKSLIHPRTPGGPPSSDICKKLFDKAKTLLKKSLFDWNGNIIGTGIYVEVDQVSPYSDKSNLSDICYNPFIIGPDQIRLSKHILR